MPKLLVLWQFYTCIQLIYINVVINVVAIGPFFKMVEKSVPTSWTGCAIGTQLPSFSASQNGWKHGQLNLPTAAQPHSVVESTHEPSSQQWPNREMGQSFVNWQEGWCPENCGKLKFRCMETINPMVNPQETTTKSGRCCAGKRLAFIIL